MSLEYSIEALSLGSLTVSYFGKKKIEQSDVSPHPAKINPPTSSSYVLHYAEKACLSCCDDIGLNSCQKVGWEEENVCPPPLHHNDLTLYFHES